jgi:hypothetical protein
VCIYIKRKTIIKVTFEMRRGHAVVTGAYAAEEREKEDEEGEYFMRNCKMN